MPVDEDFSLDNPEGITEDDIRKMNEEADELERIAEKSEKNAEKIEEAKRKLEGMTFAQLNILDKALDNQGAGGGDLSREQLMDMVIEIYEELEKAKKERVDNKKEIDESKRKIEEAEKERKRLESMIKQDISGAEGKFNEFLSASGNPMGFAKGKVLGMITKAGIGGFIIGVVIRIAETMWNEYLKTFQAGGINDIRKLMEDRDREMAELDDIIARRNGRVFFTADTDLKQGAPQFSNTERLRDQVLRYQALHLGE